MRKSSIFVLLLIFSISSLSVFAAGSGEEKSSDVPAGLPDAAVKIAGLKGPTSVGMLPLFESNPALGEGVTSSYEVVPDPQIMIARIMSGEVSIAAVPINLAAVLFNKGVAYSFEAVTGDGLIHVVSSRNDIHSMADLKGKTVYCIGQGSTPEFILRYTLQKSGIDPDKDVKIDFTFDQVSITPQLVTGKVDIAVLPEPFVSIVQAKNPAVKPVIDLQKVWADVSGTGETYPMTAILVSNELLASRPDAVETFFTVYSDAIDWVKANPGEAGPLAFKYMQMPAPVITAAVPRLNLRFQRTAAARPRVEELYSVFYSFNPASVGGKIPGDDFYE